jgi:hypothetical protein
MALLEHPLLDRYRAKLAGLPASGGGGCHPALLGVATLGVMAGVDPESIFRDLRQQVHGPRLVSDREIQDAIDKAQREHVPGLDTGPATAAVVLTFDASAALRRIVAQGRGVCDADISRRSPVPIEWEASEDALRVIETLYQPSDVLFIGLSQCRSAPGQNLRTAAEWVECFRRTPPGCDQPHIMPNPLTGQAGPTADGAGQTLRGDSCIAQYRFAVVEFDALPRDEQLAFWWAARLPVVLLVDSGGKSVHGWVRVRDVTCAAEWGRSIEQHLFRDLLQPLGVDPACKNESRLSRLPGHQRKETGRWQRLLYLAPEGKAVGT